MNAESFWFAAFPNAMLIVFVAAVLYRLLVQPVTLPDPLYRDESRAASYGRIPLQWGLTLILVAHLIALLVPGTVQAWNGAPIRLYLLEGTGLALALWAISGFLVLWVRWLRAGPSRTRLGIADVIVVWSLVIVVLSGVLTAVLERFGSAWSLATLVPWFESVFTLDPRTDLVADLPVVAQVHALTTFVLVAAFPLSRWVTIVAVPVGYLKRWWNELMRRSPDSVQGAATWAAGYGRGFVIFFLIVILTVWLPTQVLSRLADQPDLVQAVIGSGVWAVALGAVLIGLRWAQKTGRI